MKTSEEKFMKRRSEVAIEYRRVRSVMRYDFFLSDDTIDNEWLSRLRSGTMIPKTEGNNFRKIETMSTRKVKG